MPILADDVADDGETVILQLSEISENANYGRFTATGTIRDAPTGPSTLYVRDTRAEEFDREMKFVVSLFPASNTAVTVDYATQDGTAEAGFDYTARSGSLTFAAGETHKTVTVPITDDTIEESDPSEFLRFRLTNPSGAPFDGGGTSLSASGIIENHETQQTTSAGQDDEAAVAENTAPTGAPTISGDATVGETLSASASGIEDVDGLDEATFAWQWIANDGNADEDIEGATSDTYTLISADEGKTIKVRATFTDDGGTEETLLSDATDAVATAADSGLTAEFTDVPASHDGSSAFTFRIAFSEDIRNSYTRMRDKILSADGGTVTRARRVDKRKDLWEITVEPSGNDTVTVTLPTGTRCGNTPCTFDKRLLSHSLSDTLAYVAPSLSVADGEDTQALSGELTTTSTGSEELPDEVALLGNYPNPFNPHTTIRYALPKAGDVRLVVYDLVGHEVAVLIDEPKSAGHHTMRFDAADLPSGLYIYRLQAVDKMIARTMILVK